MKSMYIYFFKKYGLVLQKYLWRKIDVLKKVNRNLVTTMYPRMAGSIKYCISMIKFQKQYYWLPLLAYPHKMFPVLYFFKLWPCLWRTFHDDATPSDKNPYVNCFYYHVIMGAGNVLMCWFLHSYDLHIMISVLN